MKKRLCVFSALFLFKKKRKREREREKIFFLSILKCTRDPFFLLLLRKKTILEELGFKGHGT